MRNLIPEMLALSDAEFVFLWDQARRPQVLDQWPPGRWRSAPIPHAPERIWEQVLLPLWLRRYRVDVFHWPSGAGGLALQGLAGCRVVVTVHDLIPLIYPSDYLRNPLHRRYFTFLLALSRRADVVITISEASKQDLVTIGHFDPSKIVVIPQSVDREFLVETEKPAPVADGEPYILAIGAGEPRKNVARVIDAFLQIAGTVPHRLLVVGAPWRGRGVTIPPGVPSDRIRALGAVTNSHLRELYRNAAVFVYPSLQEGFGLPVLEAMACGAPVITSRAGSLPEVAGSAAVYVDAADPSSIARAMQDVITNAELRDRLVTAGRARVEVFSWHATAQKTLEIYERVATRGRKSG